MGDYTPVYARFEYGETDEYGDETVEEEFLTTSAVAHTVSGLVYGTTYHYRLAVRYI